MGTHLSVGDIEDSTPADAPGAQEEVGPPTGMHFRTPNAFFYEIDVILGVRYRKY